MFLVFLCSMFRLEESSLYTKKDGFNHILLFNRHFQAISLFPQFKEKSHYINNQEYFFSQHTTPLNAEIVIFVCLDL